MSRTVPTRAIVAGSSSIGCTCTAHTPGKQSQSDDDLAVLLEALSRLKEAENNYHVLNHGHGGGRRRSTAGGGHDHQVLVPGAGGAFDRADHVYPLDLDEPSCYYQAGQLCPGAGGGSDNNAEEGSYRPLDEPYSQAGDADDGELVPGVGGASSSTSADDFIPLDGLYDEFGRPVPWQDELCRRMVSRSQQIISNSGLINDDDAYNYDVAYNAENERLIMQQWHNDDDVAGHLGGHTEAAASGDHGGLRPMADADLTNDDDDGDEISRDIVTQGLHIPRIDATTTATPFVASSGGGGDGFGAVPASAAAIAGLKKRKYDGSGDDTACVICMREYKKGRTLHVMPCTRKHRFHRRCLRKWLSRSNLCPLCRHALPTEQNRSTILRINVNTR